MVIKYVNFSKRVINLALQYGWSPGACYTNLHNIKTFDRIGFLDIDWKNYNFDRHLSITKELKPNLTVARDIEDKRELTNILRQAYSLKEHANNVMIVPKDIHLSEHLDKLIPRDFLLGYSVPTKYGGTQIAPKYFTRPVHLLGGRPEIQRQLAEKMNVISLDCNRFTLDASFGDFFDGYIFRPHPTGGYENCIVDSIKNINKLWENYNCIVKNKRINNG